MELRNYIEEGIEKAGGTAALAKIITVKPQQVTDTKSMRVSLPVPACYALAELIGKDASEIIAASELVTEKKPERRAVLMKYLARAVSVSNIAACALVMTFGQSQDAQAFQGVPYQQSGPSNFQK